MFRCPTGYLGTSCEQRCPVGTFGVGCSQDCLCKNGGQCNSVTGTCTCIDHWAGQYCEKRKWVLFGLS